MKFAAFILAFLVLGMSAVPCGDESVVNKCQSAAHVIDHHKDATHDDGCTPFCHCTCCAGFSVNHFITTVSILVLPLQGERDASHASEILEISLPIWQPPQLS